MAKTLAPSVRSIGSTGAPVVGFIARMATVPVSSQGIFQEQVAAIEIAGASGPDKLWRASHH
ncbi:MAG: hypothetical protein CTY20_12660 [Hyphomicrobium sp.]|nr:MAG: hypothetical protein CTY20_12660 [Hyphomicrobium sp.]